MPSTLTDLREALFDSIDKLKDGTLTGDDARAICDVSQQILKSAEIEMQYSRLVASLETPELADSEFMEGGATRQLIHDKNPVKNREKPDEGKSRERPKPPKKAERPAGVEVIPRHLTGRR